ncbi:polysaccharide biosynthesis protein [Clostridium cuniculi]|uniref:polysaccharide biosynthesis protein n=1 Tax=Clostridium cuniculi TaxID=2548455 RepID=UPI0010554168|nr:nucleoside-diphosphate sugar epimerase/dehydratase [Clostridium cuniculi]
MVRKVLLIGAGSYGNFIINEFKENNYYEIVGIIDDSVQLENAYINGVKVIGGINNIKSILKNISVDLVLVAISNLSDDKKFDIIQVCKEKKVAVKIMPTVDIILKNTAKMYGKKDIDLSKLLNRPVFDKKSEKIEEIVNNKTILVTGGGGSIGSEICRQVMEMKPKKLIILDMYENSTYELKNELNNKFKDKINEVEVIIMSVLDRSRLKRIFNLYNPDIVFHAAAYKHVPLMEKSPAEAIKNNIFGTLNVASLSNEFNVEKFILISTDKAVNPTNIMGASKRFCEMIITAFNNESNTDFSAVRFGNVLGSNGSVIPIFKKQIESGGPVTLTHKDITRYFMLIPEAVNLVLHAAAMANGGEVFILDMGEPIKIKNLAEKMIQEYGLKPHIDIYIEEIGLRPGEKLYEELILNKDKVRYTTHNKIFIESCEYVDMSYINQCIESLSKICKEYKYDYDLKQELAYIIKTYKWSNCG